MKTTAAVLLDAGKPFELMELDLDGPGHGEVLIKYTAAGLCHSDLHLADGDLPARYPIVGGHEGSGIIEDTGPGGRRVSRKSGPDYGLRLMLNVEQHEYLTSSQSAGIRVVLHDNCRSSV